MGSADIVAMSHLTFQATGRAHYVWDLVSRRITGCRWLDIFIHEQIIFYPNTIIPLFSHNFFHCLVFSLSSSQWTYFVCASLYQPSHISFEAHLFLIHWFFPLFVVFATTFVQSFLMHSSIGFYVVFSCSWSTFTFLWQSPFSWWSACLWHDRLP